MKRVILFFLLFSGLVFADEIDDLEQRIKDIDSKIKKSNANISSIKKQTSQTKSQIKEIEQVILEVNKEIENLNGDLEVLSRNLDYSNRSIQFSYAASRTQEQQYKEKLVALQKLNLKKQSSDYNLNSTNLQLILNKNALEHEKVRVIQKDQVLVKNDISSQKQRLEILKAELVNSEKENKNNKNNLTNLISKLAKEQKSQVSQISKLKNEKAQIKKQIDKIIKERAAKKPEFKTIASITTGLGKLKPPLKGSIVVRFGQSKPGNLKSSAIEIRGSISDPIKAAADGKVIYAKKMNGLGNVVMIDYGYNLVGIYGNLSYISAGEGQTVKQGTQIGLLGLNTDGNPDLYYEVRFNLNAKNPEQFF